MAKNKTSILLSDVSIEGNLIEKDSIIFDGKINGNIKADDIETFTNSNAAISKTSESSVSSYLNNSRPILVAFFLSSLSSIS